MAEDLPVDDNSFDVTQWLLIRKCTNIADIKDLRV